MLALIASIGKGLHSAKEENGKKRIEKIQKKDKAKEIKENKVDKSLCFTHSNICILSHGTSF